MFPLTFSGSFDTSPIEEADIPSLVAILRRALTAAKAGAVTPGGGKVSFGRTFALFPYAAFFLIQDVRLPMGRGQVEFVPGSPGRVTYSFSCLPAALTLAVFFGLLSAGMLGRGIGWIPTSAFFVVACVLAVSLNWVLARTLVRKVLRNGLQLPQAAA